MVNTESVLLKHEPPKDIYSEQALISCIFIDNECLNQLYDANITPECFSFSANAMIYDAILKLDKQQTAIDAGTVVNQFGGNSKLGAIGGIGYLLETATKVSTSANILHYAKVIKDYYIRREVIKSLTDHIGDVFDNGSDITNTIDNFTKSIDKITLNDYNDKDFGTIADIADDIIPDMLDENVEVKVISSGFDSVDDIIQETEYGKQYIIAGSPGSGKTTYAIDEALNHAENGEPTLYFSLEMGKREILRKILSRMSGIEEWKIKFKKWTYSEKCVILDSYEKLKALPMVIDTCYSLTISKIRVKIRKGVRKYKIKQVYLDHIGITTNDTGEETRKFFGNISRMLKTLSGELFFNSNILSQLNRDNAKRPDRKPILQDLKESSNLEEDANVVKFVYRPDLYDILDDSGYRQPNTAFIIIAKNRGGKIGEAKLHFDGSKSKFSEWEEAMKWETRDKSFYDNKVKRMGMEG